MSNETKKQKSGGLGKFFLALIAAIVVFIALIVIQTGITNKYEKVSVVVAKDNISTNTDITEENLTQFFTTIDYDVTKLPEGYVLGSDINILANSITNYDIPKGQVITNASVKATSDITKSIALANSEDLVETSFSVSAVSDAVAGTLRRGDVITIILYRGQQENAVAAFNEDGIQRFVLEDIHIKQAYDTSGVVVEKGSDTPATMFDIISNQDDVDTLNELLLDKQLGGNVRMTIIKTNDVNF